MGDKFYNYNVDPWNSDTPDYIHVQSEYYSGDFLNRNLSSVANYPLGTPTRYFLTLPGIIDVSDLTGSRPIAIRDVDSSTTLTRVSSTPNANEYRVPPEESERRNIIEMHSGQAGHEIGYDFYMIGSVTDVSLYGQETIKVCSSDSYNNGNANYIIDTTSDAGASLNDLITTLSSNNGGTIFLEEGTYNVSTKITLRDKVNLKGQGKSTEIKKNANIDLMDITGDECLVENIYFNGNDATYTDEGLVISGTNNIITKCFFEEFEDDAIRITGDYNNIIQNEFSSNGDHCIYLSGGNSNKIIQNYSEGDEKGIELINSSSRNLISENKIRNTNNTAIQISNSSNDNTITKNEIYSPGGNGMYCGGVADSFFRTIISNNYIYNATSAAITMINGFYSSITGNIIYDGSAGGIQSSCTYVTISNNIIQDVTGEGIDSIDESYVSYMGNTIEGCSGDGIEVNTGDFLTITGNVIEGNTGDGIDCNDIEDSTIQANIVHNNTGTEITLDASSNANIVQNNKTTGGAGASSITDNGTNNSVQANY